MSRIYENVYPYRFGYLIGTVKGAIAQLGTFIEIHGENMSEREHYHIRCIIDGMQKGMEQAEVITPDSANLIISQKA